MNIMTEVAILLDRSMFIQKGTLLIGVALIAEVIDGNGVQAVFLRPVGAVAGTALHPALPHRVMGWKFRLHLHLAVAIVTERRLSLIEHLFLGYLMRLVAFIASHIVHGVQVPLPAEEGIIPVAGKADGRALTGFEPGKTDDLFNLAF